MTRSLLWAALFLCATALPAAAQDIFSGCADVRVEDDSGNAFIVQGDTERHVIKVNRRSPYLYLSDQTLRWLFFRECYFVRYKVQIDDRQNLNTNKKADCWAIRHLSDDYKFSRRDVLTIERDLETLRKEDVDFTSVAGPERNMRLTQCL